MKVIIIGGTPPPAGGIAQWTVRMMHAQMKNGWKMLLVDKKLIGKREIFGDHVKRNLWNEVRRCLRIWNDLRAHLKDKEAVVVHSCIPAYTLSMMREYVSAVISKLHRRKFIIHYRCTVPNCINNQVSLFLLKRLCNISDRVMVLNQQSVDYLCDKTKTAIELIPNFIDATELATEKTISESIQRVVYVGGVIETKGCLDIIEVSKAFPEIEFRLVGVAEEAVKVAAEGLKNVVLTGPLPHEAVLEEMKNADVFMFLSRFKGEGFSNALAEAMANGLPCIVTDWAANKDMIGEQGGVVVPVHDIANTCEALRAIRSPEVRKAQSAYNLAKAKNEYSEAVVVDRYVDCYENVIAEK